MTVIWHETADDEVEPPDGMAVVSATVWRRSWECQVDHRRYELSAYLGVDVMSTVVIHWVCRVWEYGMPMDRMTSGTRPWSDSRTGSLRLLANGIRPVAVRHYAMWGELLSATANR